MSARAAWLLVLLLAVGLCLRALAVGRTGSGFATLPILTPTSLPYEAAERAARGQPAGQGGAEALALADELLAQARAGQLGADPALAAEIQSLAADRQALLELRNRRHALNIHLMDVGVAVVAQLSPEQWQAIHMGRDAHRARAEAATFDRLLQQLRGGQPGPGSP